MADDSWSDSIADDELDALIQAVDLDGLLRLIDDRSGGDWDGLDRVRRRTRAATEQTGRQLWPAATLADYRLALDAPARWAARALDSESGRVAIGPLTEVIAVNHCWAELVDHLDPSPAALYVAHERAIRGESIDAASVRHLPAVLDLPTALAVWEPEYPISTYRPTGAEHPEPQRTVLGPEHRIELAPSTAARFDDPDTELAFLQLVEHWTTESTGSAEIVGVDGSHLDAIAQFGLRRARVVPISADEALAELAWAAATGAAHGRRRGMANGRFSMWWLLSALGDLLDDWPPDEDQVIELLGELDWYRWDGNEPAGGWRVQLAVTNRVEGTAWAMNAIDH